MVHTEHRTCTSHRAFLKKLIKDVPQKNKEVSQKRRCGIQETVALAQERRHGARQQPVEAVTKVLRVQEGLWGERESIQYLIG